MVNGKHKIKETTKSLTEMTERKDKSMKVNVIAKESTLQVQLNEFMLVDASEGAFIRKEDPLKQLLYELHWRKEKGKRRTREERSIVVFGGGEGKSGKQTLKQVVGI